MAETLASQLTPELYGVRISKDVKFEKTYDLEVAEKLDRQVMTALQKE